VSILFGRIPGLTPCGPSGGAGAVIALELARTAQDVTALFGAEPCSGRLVAAQRQALWLDMLAFIPAYTLFLASAAVALRRSGLGFALVGFNLFLFAGAFDAIEGLVLFKLLDDLPGTQRLFDGLFWTVRPKFALLGLGEILVAAMLWRGALVEKIAAGVMLAGALASLYYLAVAPHDPAMMTGYTIAWAALLIVALIRAVLPPSAA
jgi:hypothetical protein